MIKRFKFPQRVRVQTLERLKLLNDPEFMRRMTFSQLSIEELKKLESSDLRRIYRKEILRLRNEYLKTAYHPVGETPTYFYECEIRQLLKKLTKFRNQCDKNDLSVVEFESECVKFITNKKTKFIFKSQLAQRGYTIKNSLVSTSLSVWGYKAVVKLAVTKASSLKTELLKSSLPICFYTGITFKFWSYITKPIPQVSESLDVLATVSLSPIWVLEFILNKITGQFYKRWNQTPVPLNIVGEINSGTGLTWKQLNHTYKFIQDMTGNFTYSEYIDT